MLFRTPRVVALACAPVLLLACGKDPIVEVISGVSGSVELALLNPTECPACDPFDGIDTLRLEVRIGDDVVASDSFAYPGETVTLPDLAGFGVVRFTLLGLTDGRVTAAGRSAEVVLLPDVATTVPVVFLPVNRALPLAAPMSSGRYRARVVARRGGVALVVGGLDPLRRRATGTVEAYDPTTGTFTSVGELPVATAGATVTALPDGEWLVSGGYALVDDVEVPLRDVALFDDDTGVFTAANTLSTGRVDHCVAMFRERQGLALGGADGDAEYLKPDPETGAWAFESIEMRDFEAGDATGCVAYAEGGVYVQGRDAASTGVWTDDGASEVAESFAPVVEGAAGAFRYVSGAALLPGDDGTVRILGGADAGTGDVWPDGRLFLPESRRFEIVDGFQTPRFAPDLVPWMDDGWYVAGCGWADAARTAGEPTVELLAPEEELQGPLVLLDRDRQGCALAVLPDGAVLVVGGGAADGAGGADAAIVVPWMDLPAGR